MNLWQSIRGVLGRHRPPVASSLEYGVCPPSALDRLKEYESKFQERLAAVPRLSDDDLLELLHHVRWDDDSPFLDERFLAAVRLTILARIFKQLRDINAKINAKGAA